MIESFKKLNIWWKIYLILLILGILTIPTREEGIGSVLSWVAVGIAAWLTIKIDKEYFQTQFKIVRIVRAIINIFVFLIMFIAIAYLMTAALYSLFSL